MLQRVILMRRALLMVGIILVLLSLGLFLKDNPEAESNKDLLANNRLVIIREARKLGMEFPNQLSKDEVKKQLERLDIKIEQNPSSLSSNLEEKEQEGFITLKIEKGATANQVASKLQQINLIKDKAALLKLFDSLNVTNKILAGEYRFKRNDSLENILLTIIDS
ncbi:MAG: aminodeoxychorismate lyase [Candidatus Frackibacter sp. T328-2]|nr:MAG: aminodeoxychorismate lyase [Candidatus Frackibacter sp. T328-2]